VYEKGPRFQAGIFFGTLSNLKNLDFKSSPPFALSLSKGFEWSNIENSRKKKKCSFSMIQKYYFI